MMGNVNYQAFVLVLEVEKKSGYFIYIFCPIYGNAHYEFQFVVTKLLEKCREYVTTKQSSLTQWHPVLGWFSRPLDQHLNDALSTVKTQLQLLWSGPVIRVMFSTLTELVKDQVSFGLGTRKNGEEEKGIFFLHSFPLLFFFSFLFCLFFFLSFFFFSFTYYHYVYAMAWLDSFPDGCLPIPDAC